jgi:hypothetical protein
LPKVGLKALGLDWGVYSNERLSSRGAIVCGTEFMSRYVFFRRYPAKTEPLWVETPELQDVGRKISRDDRLSFGDSKELKVAVALI